MSREWINIPTPGNDFEQTAETLAVSVLDDLGTLEISGPDSAKFLQGQLTCNLQDINLQQTSLGAHCTHKGRMVASFTLCQNSESNYLFSLPKETLTNLHKSLGKYIVFSKAKLRDASDDYLTLGISGKLANQHISQLFGSAPAKRFSQLIHDNILVICISENPFRYLCLIPLAAAKTMWSTLTASATLTDEHYWARLNICDGLGEVRQKTIEEFIPQMLNLQILGGISFTKGCYTGQEIVARMQYRGILKKGMYRVAGEGPALEANDPLFQKDEAQAIGHLVIVEPVDSNHWEGLAVITHEASRHAMHTAENKPVTVLPLPYSVQLPE